MRGLLFLFAVSCLGASACQKVPLVEVQAAFSLADAVWFEEEQTLFFFYRMSADQGVEPASQLEVTWRTDTEAVDWTALSALTPIHTHLPVDCGPNARCGSYSVKVTHEPRDVGLRLRWHPEGSLALDAEVNLLVVAAGDPWLSRSLIVYGVFDEQNLHVQWRARHTFPNLHNQEVEALGLRRDFGVHDMKSGAVPAPLFQENLYWYGGAPCTGVELGWGPVVTRDRAIFSTETLAPERSAEPTVCGISVVKDALGEFSAVAVARKNPQVKPAFPSLRSPVKPVRALSWLLRICNRTIDDAHLAMQIQRLLLEGMPIICIDDWQQPGWADGLASTFKNAIDAARPEGKDLVLSLAVHHDDATGQLPAALADALATVLVPERDKATPHAVGAFVFDSFAQSVPRADLAPLVLWCPAKALSATASTQACALLPDFPDVVLGPFKFNQLAILPTRAQYDDFIARYSADEAGTMKRLDFSAPERTAISQTVDLGGFGQATFFDDEVITPAAADAFSFCAPTDPNALAVVFRVPFVDDPFPLQQLPELHRMAPQTSYALGLAWDSPFLLHAQYEAVLAGALTAVGFSVPFGFRAPGEKYYGSQLWLASSFDLSKVLLQCTRFCDLPTFDSSGVYEVQQPWRTTYESTCYLPAFPRLGDGGFPLDP